MLATAADVLPRGDAWVFEFKWDGIRALFDISGRGVRLWSRRGNDVTAAYPELVAQAVNAADRLGDVLIDGEIVAFVDGVPSFQALQERMHVRVRADVLRLAVDVPVTFVAFDLLRRDGIDLAPLPYTERRAALAELADTVTVSPSFTDGDATEAAARQHGLEGVVAKRATSAYRPGARTGDWRKLRFVRAGDFAVVGWEAPRDDPGNLSSLVIARTTAAGLELAGRVGSGLTARLAAELRRTLQARPTCPLALLPPRTPGRATQWVEPELVVEVKYTAVTSDGRLRQPVFLRIREDKTVDGADG